MEKVSKYHERVYVGCKENNGYRMSWKSSHPDLEPTETFTIGYSRIYCAYCCEQAYPIQAGLRNGGRNYDTTGHTCICEGAEAEKLKRQEQKILREKHLKEEQELDKRFKKILTHDKRKRLELRHAFEKKELEEELERESRISNYSVVSG